VRDHSQRLHDILEAIDRIARRRPVSRAAFDADELLQVWVIHHLRIIGEAARALAAETRRRLPAVPWKQIIGMRTILVHHYFGIDLDAVWAVLENDLEPLRREVESISLAKPDSNP
jgi:uncharacterized protein with HEPN domain